MKILYKKSIIAILCLFFAILSCSKNDDGGDCRDIAFSADSRKIISPQWMVSIFESLEKVAIDSQAFSFGQRYEVYSIEYKNNTYIKIMNPRNYATLFSGPFYNCSGEKIIPDYVFLLNNPSFTDFVDAIYNGRQLLFTAYYCYNPSDNCGFGTTYKPYIPKEIN